jgi:Putative transposase
MEFGASLDRFLLDPLSIEDGNVSFQWKDYADGNKTKVLTLTATEFIRRFLLHILPAGFVRIRHYGFLANRARKQKLALCRTLLNAPTVRAQTLPRSNLDEKAQGPVRKSCPVCKTDHLIPLGYVPAPPPCINSS